MNFLPRTTAQVLALLIGLIVSPVSGAQGEGLDIVQLTPGEVKFVANPAQAGGPETAVLAGDPKKPGLYTIRVKFPANSRVQPHWHPEDRMSVVVSGTLHFGYGETFDETKLKELPPGSFFTEPSRQPHFVWAKSGEVVVQTSGIGPTGTTPVSSGSERK
jgi:quercetin dioxygenase-like cupin family protein